MSKSKVWGALPLCDASGSRGGGGYIRRSLEWCDVSNRLWREGSGAMFPPTTHFTFSCLAHCSTALTLPCSN